MKLTEQIQNDICNFIRSGGFPNIAAEATGIPVETFQKWIKQGRQSKRNCKYRKFYQEVNKSIAIARLTAEIQIKSEKPELWLKSGPGKETEENPGWTTATAPRHNSNNTTINILTTPEGFQLLGIIRTALANFPQAYETVLAAIEANPKIAE